MTVDDSFREAPLAAAMRSIERSRLPVTERPLPPMATCPADGEPLICTLERAGAEFLCMVCRTWYGFLAPKPALETPELTARHAELEQAFNRGVRP